jgi:hypothetical protein
VLVKSTLLLALSFALPLVACNLLRKGDAADAGAASASASAVATAEPPPSATATATPTATATATVAAKAATTAVHAGDAGAKDAGAKAAASASAAASKCAKGLIESPFGDCLQGCQKDSECKKPGEKCIPWVQNHWSPGTVCGKP